MSHIRVLLTVIILLLGLSQSAAAFPRWMQTGKAGAFMFNLHLGPSIAAKDDRFNATKGALVLDFGFAVDSKKNAYILFPLQFQFANVGLFTNSFTIGYIMVPVGFQYDIAIPQVPGLYISPRFVAGYTAITASFNNAGTVHGGFFAPEVSAKMVFNKRWNAGFMPFSLPIIIYSAGGQTVTEVDYRILFFGGVNF